MLPRHRMANNSSAVAAAGAADGLAVPIHLQKLYNSFKLDPLLDYVESEISKVNSDSDLESEDEDDDEDLKKQIEDVGPNVYNFTGIQKKRRWLCEAICYSSDSDTDSLPFSKPPLKRSLPNTTASKSKSKCMNGSQKLSKLVNSNSVLDNRLDSLTDVEVKKEVLTDDDEGSDYDANLLQQKSTISNPSKYFPSKVGNNKQLSESIHKQTSRATNKDPQSSRSVPAVKRRAKNVNDSDAADSDATEESDDETDSSENSDNTIESEAEQSIDNNSSCAIQASEASASSRIAAMMKEHLLRKKHATNFHNLKPAGCGEDVGNGVDGKDAWIGRSYLYYGASLLCNTDRYSDHQRYMAGAKRARQPKSKALQSSLQLQMSSATVANAKKRKMSALEAAGIHIKEEDLDESHFLDQNDSLLSFPEEVDDGDVSKIRTKPSSKKEKKGKKLDAQTLAMRRHKLWLLMSRKEVLKSQRTRAAAHKEQLHNCKRIATAATKAYKQKALQSQKVVKDKLWLLKRLSRSMQVEWKKYDRIVKEQNKRAEREAEEQRKIDKEIMEAKRQQRKVNFLITLPELYTHFMQNKMNGSVTDPVSQGDTNVILRQLEEEGGPMPIDDYDSEALKQQALQTAQEAVRSQQSILNRYSGSGATSSGPDGSGPSREYSQPAVFMGQLKSYQLKGMNWLANLYYFGINGILADEMGLGKTVQAIAFLAHISEEYDTWGPFLIVTPASTLHNWTAELNRFVPDFKVVPYWGNPEERKSLRKFFDTKSCGERHNSSFHVVVTSYHIVIQDLKFLNRLKWNYMVLDEAQAIKSINSQRWKLLLGFSCRNRLLLSGTPIQNTMAELWALLHFIMPALFDSHQWFNEWFSKDIEGHVENKTHVDEKHLNRLHTILKPFMLRRVKTEVENELTDKIEIMVYCPLTLRQKFLYSGLKNKISIDELLHSSSGAATSSSQSSVTTSLMNLVMQFRKVCNHPELLERREVQSPFYMPGEALLVPRLVYLMSLIDRQQSPLLYALSPFTSLHIHQQLCNVARVLDEDESVRRPSNSWTDNWSFASLCGLSIEEVAHILRGDLATKLICLHRHIHHESKVASHRNTFRNAQESSRSPSGNLLVLPTGLNICKEKYKDLFFGSHTSRFYTFTSHTVQCSAETQKHMAQRLNKIKRSPQLDNQQLADLNEVDSSSASLHKQLTSTPRKVRSTDASDFSLGPTILHCVPTDMPTFLSRTFPKAVCGPRELYSYHHNTRAWLHYTRRRHLCPGLQMLVSGVPQVHAEQRTPSNTICGLSYPEPNGLNCFSTPELGISWSNILIPNKHSMMMDAGKLFVLDSLLSRMKAAGNRVLIYSQMTKMINLLEEYMRHRQHKYMRLDGSSKISDRRDMVDDFQTKSDIFVFLLSTRAGGVGINLTAADTVIFYDSDWNPTVDQQAMDRAHRVGQTKQVTVYRLICKGTIEERMLQRAKEKSEIQRMVISGGNYKPDTLKPKEVVSLLLDDDIEQQLRARQQERKVLDEQRVEYNKEKMRERMRKRYAEKKLEREQQDLKRRRVDDDMLGVDGYVEGSPAPSSGSDGGGAPAGEDMSIDSESGGSQFLSTSSSSFLFAAQSPVATVKEEFPSPVSSADTTEAPPMTVSAVTVRGHRKRGRPRMSTIRGRGSLSRPPPPLQDGLPTNASVPGTVVKRGRGRPRLLPLGPGHQGQRPQQHLPAALGALQQRTVEDNNLSGSSQP